MGLRIATWNINSLRLRLDAVLAFVGTHRPDVLCLQEIKCTAEQVPAGPLTALGYTHHAVAGQKAYHGVAIFSRLPLVESTSQNLCGTGEARHIAATVALPNGEPVRVHNFYVPSGGDMPDAEANPKFAHKLKYLKAMAQWLPDAARARAVVVGDINIAPLEHDVWSHNQMIDVVSHTPIEVAHFDAIMGATGLIDAMRAHVPPAEKLYTWWSYRARDWETADRGRRLDHIWLSPDLAPVNARLAIARETRGWDRPSDHVPVVLDLNV